MSKILFVIASTGFQPIEYGDAKKVLEAVGHQVVTVSDKAGVAVGKDGSEVGVDVVARDLTLSLSLPHRQAGYEERGREYAGLFFIGGPGALEHLDNEDSYKLLRDWQKTGKPYGAICISPRILAKAGVLKNKKATGWDGDGELEGILSAYGAEYIREPVVVDGNVVTGNGPSVAREWGERINEVLDKLPK